MVIATRFRSIVGWAPALGLVDDESRTLNDKPTRQMWIGPLVKRRQAACLVIPIALPISVQE